MFLGKLELKEKGLLSTHEKLKSYLSVSTKFQYHCEFLCPYVCISSAAAADYRFFYSGSYLPMTKGRRPDTEKEVAFCLQCIY